MGGCAVDSRLVVVDGEGDCCWRGVIFDGVEGVGGGSPMGGWVGVCRLCRPGDVWPVDGDGRAMFAVVQLLVGQVVVGQVRGRVKGLEGVEVLQVFVSGSVLCCAVDGGDGVVDEGWGLVRRLDDDAVRVVTYSTIDGLETRRGAGGFDGVVGVGGVEEFVVGDGYVGDGRGLIGVALDCGCGRLWVGRDGDGAWCGWVVRG